MSEENIDSFDSFLGNIKQFDDKPAKKEQGIDDELIGKSSNRKLDEKWNFKIQLSVDFFTDMLTFLKTMGYETIFRLSKKDVKIYVIDQSSNCMCYVTIEKTEMSEYINTDDNDLGQNITGEIETEPKETVIFVKLDLDELTLNSKNPVDLYFDTKERKTLYIVNAKMKESIRLEDINNECLTTKTYKNFYLILMKFLKDESAFDVNVAYPAFRNVLSVVSKKFTKKEKTKLFVKINFKKTEIDFILENENKTKSTSIQMYGDEISLKPIRDVSTIFDTEYLTKLSKLKFVTNVTLRVHEKNPIIIYTTFGAGRIKLYCVIAPRSEQNE